MVRLEKISNEPGPHIVELFSEKKGWENKVDIAFGSGKSAMKKYMDENPGEYQRTQSEMPISIEILEFNHHSFAGSNLTFRRAVSYAIDKDKQLPGFSAQSAADNIIPQLSQNSSKPRSSYNPSLAKKLFDSLPPKIKKATHKLVCHGAPGSAPGAYYEFLRDSLIAIGMKVEIFLSEEFDFENLPEDQTMIVYGRYIDAYPLTTLSHYLPGKSRVTQKANKEYQELFSKAESTEDATRKAKLIQLMSNDIQEKATVVPLHQRYQVYYQSNSVKSFGKQTWNLDIQNIELTDEAKTVK